MLFDPAYFFPVSSRYLATSSTKKLPLELGKLDRKPMVGSLRRCR